MKPKRLSIKSFPRQIKSLIILFFIIFIIAIIKFWQIKKIEIYVIADGNPVIKQEVLNKCIERYNGKSFILTNLLSVKKTVKECNPWIKQVEVNKKLPNILLIKVYEYEPVLCVKQKDKILLISSDLTYIEINKNCKDFNLIKVVDKSDVSKHLHLITQIMEFEDLNRNIAKLKTEYEITQYKDTWVVLVKFNKKQVILNPSQSGADNFARFWQAYAGLKSTGENFKTMNLLFDRVIIK